METKTIKIQIENDSQKEVYEGIANILQDILEYQTEKETILFDFTRNRLTKKDKEKRIVLDFEKQEGTISNKELSLSLKLEDVKINKTKEKIQISYKIEEEKFHFLLEEWKKEK